MSASTALPPEAKAPSTTLIDVQDVAAMLACSARHVYRLVDAAKMPSPLRLGSLVRWNRAAILEWINAGCPPVVRKSGGR